ncbi:MAG: phosphotransferase family protein [Rhodospirillales bacterium]|jgi:aminoglycoside phosphotransferase (APT) family kinase protein
MTDEMDATAVTEVREAHAIDQGRLAEFLKEALPETQGSMKLSQFAYGQSNPTYVVGFDDVEYVLRKQPPGELLPSAHQVDREFRVQKALSEAGYPVAKQFLYSDNREIVGTPFYVMERMQGRVFKDTSLPDCSPEHRAEMYKSLAETLAQLHTFSPAELGLEDFGRPGDWYRRQFKRWSRNFSETQTQAMPAMQPLMEWLDAHMPEDNETRIAHGDYRMGNVMFHPTEPRVVAVFDWEISTLGHPLGDLAYCAILYGTNPQQFFGLEGLNSNALGIPTFEEFNSIYCEAAGRSDGGLTNAHMAHAFFRFAAILDGVRARGLAGNAASTDAADIGLIAPEIAARGWKYAQAKNSM